MLPDSTVSPHAALHFKSNLHGSRLIAGILLALFACRRIHLLQLRYGKGCFLWVLARICLVKIDKLWLPLLQLRDNQSQRLSPVPKVNVPDNLMPAVAQNPFYAFANHSRAEMSHMKRLRNVGAAVIDNYFFGAFRLFETKFCLCPHRLYVRRQETLPHLQI